MKKKAAVCLIAAMSVWLAAAVSVNAHVTVFPKQTTQGAYEVFTVRVPVESEQATTKVEVKIPKEAEVSRVQPMPGWSYDFAKDADGVVTAIVWTATEGGLKDGEFGEFKMQGKVADDAKEIVWKAYQTSADGTVVEWTGSGEDAKTPASVTTVAASSGAGDGHGGGESEDAASEKGDDDDKGNPVVSYAALGLSVVALALAVASRRKTK